MRLARQDFRSRRDGSRTGSTFVIVLWIAFGLVSLTLYFAHSMSLELRAADHRVAGVAAEQAIEGGLRYVTSVLLTSQTNGVTPDPTSYLRESVPVGKAEQEGLDARFWLIGRDPDPTASSQLAWGLIEENSKLNLNTATSNMLIWLPWMNEDLAGAILDWRDTNGGTGGYEMQYSLHQPGYLNKCSAFETVDELRLLYGADMEVLLGEDRNRNGILDASETDLDRNGVADPGLLDCVTVYSREPNTYSNGVEKVDIRQVGSAGPFQELLVEAFGSSRANDILMRLGATGGGGPGGPGGPGGGAGGTPQTFRSPLQLYRQSGMTLEEFEQIADALTTTTNSYIQGRVNINTASVMVLSCLPGLSESMDLAQMLADYRATNPDRLHSIAWVVEALGSNNNNALDALQRSDCITTRSYQYAADIAAVGPHGRGFRRTRFIIDTSSGMPQVMHRQDLTHLGWALGREVREQLLAHNQ